MANNKITTDDITVIGESESLTDFLSDKESEINKIKSNVKWLYKYGGVGSGRGGGSSEQPYSIDIRLNNISIENGGTIILPSIGTYDLYVKINHANGDNFIFQYSTGGSTNKQELSLNNLWEYTVKLNFAENTNLTVSVMDDNGNKTTYNVGCIVNPYIITTKLVDEDNKQYNGTDLFINTIKNKKLYYLTTIDSFVDGISFGYFINFNGYTYYVETDSPDNEGYLPINVERGTIYSIKYQIPEEYYKSECAGQYNISCNLKITPNGQESIKKEYPSQFFLIPYDYYLRVSSNKTFIYDEPIDEPDSPIYNERMKSAVYPGYINLDYIIYEGVNQNKKYLTTYTNEISESDSYDSDDNIKWSSNEYVFGSTKQTAQIYIKKTGQVKIQFKTLCSNVTKIITKYIFVKKIENIKYYDDNTLDKENWYRISDISDDFDQSLRGKPEIYKTLNDVYSKTINIHGFYDNKYNYDDLHISFSIQYSQVNPIYNIDETNLNKYKPFIEFNTGTTENDSYIYVYQNKLCLKMGDKQWKLIDIYIPKVDTIDTTNNENYHLIDIVFRKIQSQSTDNSYIYEMIVYVDGIIEGAINEYLTTNLNISECVINNYNMSINLLEINYINASGNKTFNDAKVVQHYMAYLTNIKNVTTISGEKLLTAYKDFKFDEDNIGMIHIDTTDPIDNIIESNENDKKIPVMVAEISESYEGSYEDLIYDLTRSYTETDPISPWDISSIQWSTGENTLIHIYTGDAIGYKFSLKIQGSSTRQFKCKNFELAVQSTNSEQKCVFSPNFDSENTDTFLPEQSFTLKADVVDSSHSNNNAIGKFVNDATTRFTIPGNYWSNPNDNRIKYVKNNLQGFPFLLFIKISGKDKDNKDKTNIFYFGIYNFNLGRKSYFNLGYKDVTKLPKLEKGFKVYSIHNTDFPNIFEKFICAEIAGGSQYNDFSQYDQSIVMPIADEKEGAMFGDFEQSPDRATNYPISTPICNFVESITKAGAWCFEKVHKMFGWQTDKYGYAIKIPAYNEYYNDQECTEPLKDSTDHYHIVDTLTISQITEVDELSKWEIKCNRPDVITQDGNNYYYDGKIVYAKEIPLRKVPFNQVPDYTKQYKRILDGGLNTYKFKNSINQCTNDDSLKDAVGNLLELYTDGDIQPKDKLDYTSALEYYVVCMAFGMVDSVLKNLNIKTWDDNTFNVAFYDMDTALGINNEGRDVDFIAFSDYWDCKTSKDEHTLTDIMIYRDYFPTEDNKPEEFKDVSGYDIPSSYLFAIVKYLYLKINDYFSQKMPAVKTPSNLWAQWRQTSGDSGKLPSAQYFIDNYFKAHNDIPGLEFLWNANYKYKYFRYETDGSHESGGKNFLCKGRRIYKTLDWLKNRFNLLDAYFNLTQKDMKYEYLNIDENSKSDDIKNMKYEFLQDIQTVDKPSDDNTKFKSNKDITFLQNIFSKDGEATTTGNAINCNIKALEYSPLIIFKSGTGTLGRYFLLDSNQDYKINIVNTGSQSVWFYGSKRWTEIDNIDSFIEGGNSLSICSNYLRKIKGTSRVLNSLTLDCPALTDIELTSSNYNNTLKIDNDFKSNIKDINISNSSINLNINKATVKTVLAKNCKNNTIEITGCKLDELNLKDSTFNSLSLFDCVPDDFYKNKTINIGDFCCCTKKLGITTLEEHAKIIINANDIENENIKLESITLGGFEEIEINGLKYLNSLSIDTPENLKKLTVVKCSESVKGEYAGYKNLNLSGCTNLESICFYNTQYIESIEFSENSTSEISLDGSIGPTFQNCKKLKYLKTYNNTLVLTGGNTFNSASDFTLQQSQGTYPGNDNENVIKFTVKNENVILLKTFRGCSETEITIEHVKAFYDCFKNNDKPNNAAQNVKNISELWVGCRGIKYDIEYGWSEYCGRDCCIAPPFPTVTNVSSIYMDTGVYFLNRYMFKYITSNSVNYGSIVTPQTGTQYSKCIEVTYDSYYDMFKNATSLKVYNPNGNSARHLVYKKYTNDNNYTDESETSRTNPELVTGDIKMSLLFNDENQTFENVTTISSLFNVYYGKDQIIDVSGIFNNNKYPEKQNWNNTLSEISTSFNLGNSNLPMRLKGLADIGFNYLKDDIKIKFAFGLNIELVDEHDDDDKYKKINGDTCVNLFKLFKKTQFEYCLMFTNYSDSSTYKQKIYNFKKYLNVEDFESILKAICNGNISKTDDIGEIFSNTYIILNNYPDNGFYEPNITEAGKCDLSMMNYMFNNLKAVYLEGDEYKEIPLHITNEFFTHFPNVTNLYSAFRNCFFDTAPHFNLFDKMTYAESSAYVTHGNLAYYKYIACDYYEEHDWTPINVTRIDDITYLCWGNSGNVDYSYVYFNNQAGTTYAYVTLSDSPKKDYKQYDKDKRILCNMITYNYRQEITDMSYTFSDCKYNKRYYDHTSEENEIPRNSIWPINSMDNIDEYKNTVSGNTTYKYYTSKSFVINTFSEKQLSELDTENLITNYSKSVLLNRDFNDYDHQIHNQIITNNEKYEKDGLTYSYLFTAPDIFYGCTKTGADVSSCFTSYTSDHLPQDYIGNDGVIPFRLCGMLPQHMFSNIKEYKCQNFIQNLDILPHRKYTNISKDDDSYDIYTFVPDNFITINDLSNVFNFNLLLPNNGNIDGERDKPIIKYFIMTNKSISKSTQYLIDSLPSNIWDNYFGMVHENGWISQNHPTYGFFHDKYPIFFGIMYTPDVDPNKYGKDYIDLGDFKSLYCDNLFNHILLSVMNCQMLNDNPNIKFSTAKSGKSISSICDSFITGISKYLILPTLTNKKEYIFDYKGNKEGGNLDWYIYLQENNTKLANKYKDSIKNYISNIRFKSKDDNLIDINQ